jgi:hypothetical protein
MRVTVEPGPLIGILAMLGERAPRRNAIVRLSASGGKVCIEGGVTAAATDAAVWEEGECSVSRVKLLRALEPHRNQRSVRLQADCLALRVDDLVLPVSDYVTHAAEAVPFQIFLATTAGTVSCQRPLQPMLATAA